MYRCNSHRALSLWAGILFFLLVNPLSGQVDLQVSKEDRVPIVSPGQVYLYEVPTFNDGRATAAGVVVTEMVPEGTVFRAQGPTPDWSCADGSPAGTVCTYDIALLPPDDPTGLEFHVQVLDRLPADYDLIVNTVTISDDGTRGPDLNPADNTGSHSTPIDVSGIAPDLVVSAPVPSPLEPGEVFDVPFTVTNTGSRGTNQVVLTAATAPYTSILPAQPGWNCFGGVCERIFGTLQPGDTASATLRFQVLEPLPPGVLELPINSQVTDDGANGADLNPVDNTLTTVAFLDPNAPGPDLAIDLDDNGATAAIGRNVTYEALVTNTGRRGTSGTRARFNLPEFTIFDANASSTGSWTCVHNQPGPGECDYILNNFEVLDRAYLVYTFRLDDNPRNERSLRVNASVLEDGTNGVEANPSDNSDAETTPIELLEVAFVATLLDTPQNGEPLRPGETVQYTAVLTNEGRLTAADVTFREDRSPELRLVAGTVTTTHGVITSGNDPDDEAVTVDVGDLPQNVDAVITFELLLEELPSGSEIFAQGFLEASNGEDLSTDDPDTPLEGDDTRTLVGDVILGPVDIPTVGELGLGLLILILASAGLLIVRRRSPRHE